MAPHPLMEWFAPYGISLDQLSLAVAAPVLEPPLEKIYADWVPEALKRFQLPMARVCALEEPIKLAAQLRGNTEDWVARLIEVGNAPLAARIALGKV